MASLRIHFDHQVFSLQNTGGNSRYLYELMRHLAVHPDVEPELFLGLHQSQMPFAQLAQGNVRIIGTRSSLLPGSRRYIANELLNNAHGLLSGRFDIYHPTHHRYLPMVSARRTVVTHHDCTAEKFPEDFRYYQRICRAKASLYSRADAIICISEASRQDLLRFYNVDPAKTRVIHHGANRLILPSNSVNSQTWVSGHDFSRAEQRPFPLSSLGNFTPQGNQRGLESGRPYLLYVGWRVGYKNFAGLLRAFRDAGLYQDLDLVVLGGGSMSPAEERLIADLGLPNAVVHIGHVDDAILAEAYSGARLLAYPSLSEGFGLPPLEAMHLGCPVLVCNTSCLPEICADAAFYFEPNSSESLREALIRAVNDDSARAQAVARGFQIAAQYSWEKCSEETLALYRECL